MEKRKVKLTLAQKNFIEYRKKLSLQLNPNGNCNSALHDFIYYGNLQSFKPVNNLSTIDFALAVSGYYEVELTEKEKLIEAIKALQNISDTHDEKGNYAQSVLELIGGSK